MAIRSLPWKLGGFEIGRYGDVIHHLKAPKILREKRPDSYKSCVGLLSNGRVLAIPYPPEDTDTAILELDYETGKIARRVPLYEHLSRSFPDALPNGNYVIWTASNTLLEVDSQGKPIGKPGSLCGVRLRNGNTVAVRLSRIVEFSPDGRALWEAICQLDPNQRIQPERLHECLCLVKLGFDLPRPADLDLQTSLAYLMKRLKSKDRLVRSCAARDLGRLGPKAGPAIPALVELFDDPDPLHPHHSALVILHVLDEIGPAAFPAILKAARHKQITVRAAALEDLSRFTDKTKMLVPLWLDALKDKDALIRLAALDGLSRSVSTRLFQKEDILEAFQAKDIQDKMALKSLRWNVIDAFRRIGPKAKATIPLLTHLLRDKSYDSELRGFATSALATIGGRTAAIEEALMDAANDDDEILRMAATNVLKQLRNQKPAQ
jgi:HEAT repeat protein